MPNVLQLAKNFGRFLLRLIRTVLFMDRPIKALEGVRHDRERICGRCPEFNNTTKFLWWSAPRCQICGCVLKAKISFEFENCPIAKW
jgi:hypothetical protein